MSWARQAGRREEVTLRPAARGGPPLPSERLLLVHGERRFTFHLSWGRGALAPAGRTSAFDLAPPGQCA